MSDDPPDPPARLLFGKITPGNAHGMLNRVAVAWTVIVAVRILGIEEDLGANHWSLLFVIFEMWAAAGAYFVRSRKSRVVAIAQVAYVIIGGFTAFIPYVREQTPLFYLLWLLLVIFMASVAWRGVHATWAHHSAANLRTEWKHVVAIFALMTLIVPCVAVATVVGMDLIIYPDTDEREVKHAIETALISFPLMMGLLTWKYPFAKRDVAKHVAEVFE